MAQHKGPRPFTGEEKQFLLRWEAEHQQKMESDPEYRQRWEKMQADLKRILPVSQGK